MQITVEFCSYLKTIFKIESMELEIGEGFTVSELLEKLIYDLDENDRKIFGNVKRNPNSLIIAINGTFQDLNICLLEGDKNSLSIPLVGG